ncbi:hypothetical protein [Pseudomonas sp.]|uniref:hypothetical protein n=1 Tax=Pseudomonas sp. TaxID=306 RepID=UPI003C788F06
MQLIEWIRRRRRERTRVLFIAQVVGESPETAALTWMTRHALFGFMATLFQMVGVVPLILTLLKLCLEFPSLGYWPQMVVIMGGVVVIFWFLARYREVWVLILAALYLAFAVVLLDFAVANLRTPQTLPAPVVDRDCHTPPRGRTLDTPKQVCEQEIQLGRYSHWINVTGTGLWMSDELAVELRRGFLGLTYPRLGAAP